MSPKTIIRVCDKCKKPLKNTACPACEGSGFYLELPGAKKQCQNCKGSGRVLKCPDELKHILEDIGSVKFTDPKPIYKSFQRGKPFILSPEKTNKQIQGPNHPNKILPPWHKNYQATWHPNHPLNPNNPFNPSNPNNLLHPNNPNNPESFRNNPFNWNNQIQRNSRLNRRGRLPGDPGTDAPPPAPEGKRKL